MAEETELKGSDCMKVINCLAGIAAKEVKSAGKHMMVTPCSSLLILVSEAGVRCHN